MKRVLRIPAGLDELGHPEEFSWDLLPVVPADRTLHLERDGLPKVGTTITPGMILVGKIGKTRLYLADHQPTSLELHGNSSDELRKKYGMMWYDASYYADADSSGVVEMARLETFDGATMAVVTLT